MRRWLSRPLLLLAAAVAGATAPASSPTPGQPWIADAEDQFLLDLQVRQRVLGEGVRAYPVPGGTCVILGDLIAALDLPLTIDLKARTAQGWAFEEKRRLRIDRAAAQAEVAGERQALAPSAIRDAPEGWCVDTAAAGRWLGVGLEARTEASVLLLTSEKKLPAELAAERRERASLLTRASVDLTDVPKVRLPYRMWRSPSVDVMMDTGLTYSARTGAKIDHRASLLAAGELFQMSYEARVSLDRRGMPTSLRLRSYRADPEGGLLGPLKATQVAVGDVEGVTSAVVGGTEIGRGAMLTNRPIAQAAAFDRTQFNGELPPGWDAELYRNGELIAFTTAGSDGRYRFDDVALAYGDNRFEILTFGPQGQVRSRIETVRVGPQAVPPGTTWYWAGLVDPGRDLVDLGKEQPPPGSKGLRAAAAMEHGFDQRTSVAALVQSLVAGDERLTYVEGAVRRSIGPALAEVGIARDSRGGLALRGQALAKIGSANLSWSSFLSRDFAARPQGLTERADHRLSLDVPLRLSETIALPLRADVRWSERTDGARHLEASGRTSLMLSRFNLASVVRWREIRPGRGQGSSRELEAGLIGSGRIGPVRVRGSTEWELVPSMQLRRAELSGYWSRGGAADWEGALAFERSDRRLRGRLSHIRRFDQLALAGSVEASSDGSVAAGLSLNFSLDRGPGGWRASRQSLAGSGSVRARVFRDDNGNGLHEPGEPLETGALVTAGMRLADRPTGKDGWTSVAGLDNHRPVAIGVDVSSLSEPHLVPAKPAQLVVPRPGVAAEVLIPLTGGGAIEGSLIKDGGGPFEGLDLELVNAAGKVVATVRTDFDGFFLFERVPAGRYQLRLSGPSREAAKASSAMVRDDVLLGADQAVLRLGSLVVRAMPELAVNHKVVSGDFAKTP